MYTQCTATLFFNDALACNPEPYLADNFGDYGWDGTIKGSKRLTQTRLKHPIEEAIFKQELVSGSDTLARTKVSEKSAITGVTGMKQKRYFSGRASSSSEPSSSLDREHAFSYGILKRRKRIKFIKSGSNDMTEQTTAAQEQVAFEYVQQQEEKNNLAEQEDVIAPSCSLSVNKQTREQSSVRLNKQSSEQASGASVSKLYRNIVGLSKCGSTSAKPELSVTSATNRVSVCDCGRTVQHRIWNEHQRSLEHLLAVKHQEPPLRPLAMGSSSFGYRVLMEQGWSPMQRKGLGAEGREGVREPIRASAVKSDKRGISFHETGSSAVDTDNGDKFTIGARRARTDYEKDRQRRMALYRHFYE